ncbi:aldo/keto reductase [Xanthomonas citri pv. mangiferaeindicae]|nr:aldo/keto reductase [Xanthomonas citri pv. mangiferaeindicae]
MDTRFLGRSGLRVPVLGFGVGTFGGRGPLFGAWGDTDAVQARRLVDLCLDAGAGFFDTADAYSDGASETILGAAIRGRRDRVLLSTKVGLRVGADANAVGASRTHLLDAVDTALRRLDTDYIDLLQLHAFDAMTPLEETLSTLDGLVRAGKVRYLGASNHAGWQLMKALAIADRDGLTRYVAHQAYYSLAGRDYEWELMPLGLDQGVGAVVWSPLAWGRLTGRIRRGQPLPTTSRLHATAAFAPPIDDARLYRIVDALDEVAADTGHSVPQIALNWLLQRPGVSTVLLGARNEAQLRENLGAAGWTLDPVHMAQLDAASAVPTPYPYYPYWNGQFAERSPAPVPTPDQESPA